MSTVHEVSSGRKIIADDHQIRFGDSTGALYGGAVHYWRLERDKWDEIIDKVKAMGFNTVSIYIPWEIHEIERGVFDFGQIDPRKDVDAFLTLIESKGLNIVVRPGPQINSELTWFGYPLRILADPALQALNGQGTKAVLTQVPKPIPAVSYAVDKFFDETALWYDAICPILAKHAYPKGRIVAAQVDNEMAFFFHVNAYACDFHPDSIKGYRAFLKKKYGTVQQLGRVYRKTFTGFDAVDPPRRFDGKTMEDIPYYSDWVEYREIYLIDSIDRLAKMMRARGLDQIALFHNYPHPLGPGGAVSGFTTPFNIMGLEEKVDFVGFDIYSRKELYDHVKTVVSYVVGTSRYPYIPEFIAGVWSWYLHPGNLADEEFVTKAALMHGAKGFSRYMLVERDRWFDSPIRRDGRVRPDQHEMFGRVNQVLQDNRFVDLRRQADVLLLANREYDRLEAASVLVSFPGDFLETPSGFSEYANFVTVSEETLGFEQSIPMAKSEWFSRVYAGLGQSGYPFLLSDTALKAEKWGKFSAVVLGSFEYLNQSLQHNLVSYAEAGKTVVLGPKVPHLNERMEPEPTLRAALLEASSSPVVVGGIEVGRSYRVGSGRIVVITDWSNPAGALCNALDGSGLIQFTRNDQRLDVAIHRPVSAKDKAVVFVANPTSEAIEAKVSLNTGMRTAHEIWSNRNIELRYGVLTDKLPAYSIHIYECVL
jgi:beta-galactosidase